jgi:hypothetical protein
MNKFKYQVALSVEVEAFDEDDAFDALQDAFGIGDNGSGITVVECEWDSSKR